MGESSEKKPSSSPRVWRQNLQQMLFLQLLFPTILYLVCGLYLTGVNRCVASFYLTCLEGEDSSWSFLWGMLFSQAAELNSVFSIACMVSYSRMKLFRLIFALQLGKTVRHSWSYTSVPSTKISWVPCNTSCWLLVSHFLGRELENAGNSSIKNTFISIPCIF